MEQNFEPEQQEVIEYDYQTVEEAPRGPFNFLGLFGMICGIIGLTICWYPFLNLIHPTVGLILSLIGKKRPNPKMAKIGLILSIIGLILSIAAIIVFFVFLDDIFDSGHSYRHHHYDYYYY